MSENDKTAAIIQGSSRLLEMSQIQRLLMNLSNLLHGMVTRRRPDLSARGISLEAFLHQGLLVLADTAHMAMGIHTLLLNARGALQVVDDQVDQTMRVHLRAEEEVAQLLINGNVPGVSKTNGQRIYEIHFTCKVKGMGHGLWMCRAVDQKHGG